MARWTACQRRRVDAQRVGQRPPGLLVQGQRVGRRPAADSARMSCRAAFAQRMQCGELFSSADQPGPAAEGELRVDAILDGGDPQLLQARDRAGGESRVRDVGERRAAPQAEGLAQQRRTAGRVALGSGRRDRRSKATASTSAGSAVSR